LTKKNKDKGDERESSRMSRPDSNVATLAGTGGKTVKEFQRGRFSSLPVPSYKDQMIKGERGGIRKVGGEVQGARWNYHYSI